MSVAEILSRTLKSSDFASDIENVLFAFFNGEAFDYIGFVYTNFPRYSGYVPGKITIGEYQNPQFSLKIH